MRIRRLKMSFLEFAVVLICIAIVALVVLGVKRFFAATA